MSVEATNVSHLIMKQHTLSWKQSLLALTFVLAARVAAPVHAAEKPQSIKVGETAQVELEAEGRKDYTVSLAKGTYRLVWDAQRSDMKSSNIIGKVSLLKPNGVIITDRQINFNEVNREYRVGSVLNVPKPFVARFRIYSEAATKNWFTVVPTNPGRRVPFGWGAKITPARISSDNGVGGELEPLDSAYHSITLPKGKWSVSLGLQLPDDKKTNLFGTVDLMDTLGFTQKSRFVNMNEIDNQARTEGIITVTKPTPYLLRVTNGSTSETYTYDVTIEPAS